MMRKSSRLLCVKHTHSFFFHFRGSLPACLAASPFSLLFNLMSGACSLLHYLSLFAFYLFSVSSPNVFCDLQFELFLNYCLFSLTLPCMSPSFPALVVLVRLFSSPFTLAHVLVFFIYIFTSLPHNSCALPSLLLSPLSFSLSDYCCLLICLLFLPQKPPGHSSD